MKIYRDIKDHWIYSDSDHFKAWFEMLSNARYVKEPKTDTYEGILYTLNYGEFIFGRLSWSKRLGISEQKLRTLMRKLQAEGMIKATSRFTKLTIYKIQYYEKYNQQDNQQEKKESEGLRAIGNLQDNQRITSSQPADNHRITTNEESREGEDGKESISALFESLWKLYPKKEGKGSVSKTQKEKLARIGLDEMTRAIERYKLAKEGTDKKYIQNGSTFFNSGFVDYLDANYQEKEDHDNGEPNSNGANSHSKRKPWELISEDDKAFFDQGF
ncbi:hypothetical protein [Desulfosporosinus orientis]|uniref:hypothetical protein n=1 Tax=Desulfosporosinus orientis TaxID=1563 RepID=UPI00130535F5|nr:hypothetical protein [Desulfosporosinus orientis]